MKEFGVITPVRVCEIFKRAFGLRDGIKRLVLTAEPHEVSLSVEYLVNDRQCAQLENLQEFRLVPKQLDEQ